MFLWFIELSLKTHFSLKNGKFKFNGMVKATAIQSRQNRLAYTDPNHGNHVREWYFRVEIESRDRGDVKEPDTTFLSLHLILKELLDKMKF